jgi:DNA topoisomerase-1
VVGRDVHRVPPPAFTTSKLQQAAARRFGWSGKLTMNVAQKLYERGLITYHRTDSVYLSDKATEEFRKYIGEKYGNDYVASKVRFYKNNSKNAQEAHEAIRPTTAKREELEATDVRERKLYEMIWKRAIATQAAAARIKNTTVNLTDKDGLFKASGVNMLFDGYLKLTGDKFEEQTLPELKEGDKVLAEKVLEEMIETNPPPRYTDASLVGSLEKQGIGRPSTYAPIISTIQNRQYVEKDEGKFKPTSLGMATNEFLVKNFEDILSLPFTAEMEEKLDLVALGKLKWKKMMAGFWKGFEKEVKEAEKNGERVKVETEKLGEKCPECKEGELVIRVGRFGKFISCDRFPECKYTRQFKEMAGFKCPKCGADGVVRRTKTGRKFFGCSAYPTCKWAGWKKP